MLLFLSNNKLSLNDLIYCFVINACICLFLTMIQTACQFPLYTLGLDDIISDRFYCTSVKPHSVLTKSPNGFLTVFRQFIVKPYHITVLPRCQYPNDEDLNICFESGANKLAFGELQEVRVLGR